VTRGLLLGKILRFFSAVFAAFSYIKACNCPFLRLTLRLFALPLLPTFSASWASTVRTKSLTVDASLSLGDLVPAVLVLGWDPAVLQSVGSLVLARGPGLMAQLAQQLVPLAALGCAEQLVGLVLALVVARGEVPVVVAVAGEQVPVEAVVGTEPGGGQPALLVSLDFEGSLLLRLAVH